MSGFGRGRGLDRRTGLGDDRGFSRWMRRTFIKETFSEIRFGLETHCESGGWTVLASGEQVVDCCLLIRANVFEMFRAFGLARRELVFISGCHVKENKVVPCTQQTVLEMDDEIFEGRVVFDTESGRHVLIIKHSDRHSGSFWFLRGTTSTSRRTPTL